jgi:hypothetical protein
MATHMQNRFKGSMVRIWDKSKERLVKVVEKKIEKENRNVSEAELVSKAVDMYCAREEKKLGI